MATQPKYLHPSVTSNIIDNAVLTLSASGLSNQLICLEAEKGQPRKAVYVSTVSEFQFNFGDPNYSKYGQAGLNAVQWLRAGGGLWCIRVVPDDETYATLRLGVAWNGDQQYTNDEEEYEALKLTNDQIRLWNAQFAGDSTKLATKGDSTDESINKPLYYVTKPDLEGNPDPAKVERKLGLLTEDEIAIRNLEGGFEGENKLIPFAAKRIVTNTIGGVADIAPVYEKGNKVSEKFARPADGTNPEYYDTKWILVEAGDDDTVANIHLFESLADAEKAAEAGKTVPKACQGRLNVAFNGDTWTPYTLWTTAKTIDVGTSATVPEGLEDEALNKKYQWTLSEAYTLFKETYNAAVGSAHLTNTVIVIKSTVEGKSTDAWVPCYEVYSATDKVTPITSSVIDANAFTVQEAEDWNYIHADEAALQVVLPVEITAGGDTADTSSPFVNAKASTGVVKKSKTYYVNNAATGDTMYGRCLTEEDIIFYNSWQTDPLKKLTKGAATEDDTTEYIESQWFKTVGLVDGQIEGAVIEKVTTGASGTAPTDIQAKYINAVAANGLASFMKYESTMVTFSKLVSTSSTASTGAVISDYLYREVILKSKKLKEVVKYDSTAEKYKWKVASDFATGTIPSWYNDVINYGAEAVTEYAVSLSSENQAKVKVILDILATMSNEEKPGVYKESSVTHVQLINATAILQALTVAPSSTQISLGLGARFITTAKMRDQLEQTSSDELTVSSTPLSEYVTYPTFQFQDNAGNMLEPNMRYIVNYYQAIGFTSTPYTEFELKKGRYQDTSRDIEMDFQGFDVDATNNIINTVDKADMKPSSFKWAEVIRFVPKGSGKWYNNLAVSLSYDNSFDQTYPDWSMFKLDVIEKYDGAEIVRESYNVALDPDAISGARESLFIESIVNRYSSYLTCVVNYDNLVNLVEAKLAVLDDDGEIVKDIDGNEIVPRADDVVKYIFNQITLKEFNERTFGIGYEEQKDFNGIPLTKYEYTDLMSAIGYDKYGCHLDTTLFETDEETQAQIHEYQEPFVSAYYMKTVASNNVLYLAGGSHGHGWGYEYVGEDEELHTTATLDQALTRGYNGTYDPLITNVLLTEIDTVLDANYGETVKTAMSELSAITRQDCVTILDMNLDCANASQAIEKRKGQMQYNTYYTSIFSQHIEIVDEWSGKPIKVTPTFFLSSKIPQNDTQFGPATNFVGPRRGVISGFRSISWLPTEPEKTELYKNQINYIETDAISTQFATELTSQTRNTPLSLIHPVRVLLKVKREMERASRNYRSEFASNEVVGQLQQELNNIAAKWVLGGGFEYITPVINTSEYDRQQRICRVNVDLAFTDIMERFVFDFVVNRA